MTAPLHQRYLALVEEIERSCAVSRWKYGDLDLWPLARMDLFLDMFRSGGGETAAPAPAFVRRALASFATPLTNAWKSRHDLSHWVPWPRPAHAVILGDGVSLDCVDGAWQDRYGEPLIAALERRGHATFLMQNGNLGKLPWRRPTFAANSLSAWGALAGSVLRGATPDLPDHAAVRDLLARHEVAAPSLHPARLARRARSTAAAASAFQRVLRIVRPKLAFVVTCYAGLGPAFALACRREGILCVDLQHCPQDGTHKAYSWHTLPDHGYSTLPALFWTWKAEDAAHIQRWAGTLHHPWHRSLHGGHTQLAAFLDDEHPATRTWDRQFAAIGGGTRYDREILVALQPIGGRRAHWDALAAQIDAGPASWRWWIRRHPSSTPAQDAEYAQLLALRRPHVVLDDATRLPLPALLRHMSVLISLASGAAGEAAAFGVPALFLDSEAHGPFAGLIERGEARVVDVTTITTEIERISTRPLRLRSRPAPPIDETMQRIEAMAEDYAQLCRSALQGR